MPTTKEAIAEALLSLDQTNDKLWTDDGSPLVSEVQRVCNDPKITRAMINEALPGFARKTASIAEDVQPGDETGGIEPEASPEAIAAHRLMAPPPASEVQAEEDGFEDDTDRVKAIAQKRVRDAEIALADAKTATAEAYRAEKQAEQRLTRALQQYAAKFPPMSAAENIQHHLARQQEVLRERITGSRFEPNAAMNPVDATMMDRKRDNGRNGKGPRGQTPAPFLPRKAAVSY